MRLEPARARSSSTSTDGGEVCRHSRSTTGRPPIWRTGRSPCRSGASRSSSCARRISTTCAAIPSRRPRSARTPTRTGSWTRSTCSAPMQSRRLQVPHDHEGISAKPDPWFLQSRQGPETDRSLNGRQINGRLSKQRAAPVTCGCCSGRLPKLHWSQTNSRNPIHSPQFETPHAPPVGPVRRRMIRDGGRSRMTSPKPD